MANEAKRSSSVAAAEDLLQDLKQRAQAAHAHNDVFMMGVMSQLLKVVSPIVTRAIARANREDLAKINADHRELKEKNRNQKDQSPNQSGPNPTTRLGD
jgi:hypothetical protein